MKCYELKSLLAYYHFKADIYKSGKRVLLDLEDNPNAELILTLLNESGCYYWRESPQFLPEVFTVEWNLRQ